MNASPVSVILGTRNAHKLEEMAALLPELILEPLPGEIPEAPEDGDSFAENARSKSLFYARATGRLVLADDSGICVDALDGAPGIHSARYAGPDGDDEDNTRKLLQEMAGRTDRRASYVCVLSLAGPDGERLSVEGRCHGRLLESPDGDGGFGYDPIFFSDDLRAGFARVPAADKHRVSHRARACEALRQALEAIHV